MLYKASVLPEAECPEQTAGGRLKLEDGVKSDRTERVGGQEERDSERGGRERINE